MSSPSRLEHLRARIELPVLRQVIGTLEGRHRSRLAGRSQDFDDLTDYRPGDDVSDIDWKTSARAGHPVIRRFQHETNLSLILAVDTGRTMGALAPSGESKEAIAIAVCELLAFLAKMRGDRVGLIAGDSRRMRRLPARSGNEHLETLLRHLERDIDLDAPSSDVGAVLRHTLSSTTQRSLVILVTDEAHPDPGEEDLLRKIRVRHEVMIFAVADAVATDLPKGVVPVDVEMGPLPDFVLDDEDLAAQARQVSIQRKNAVRDMLRRRGIPATVLTSSDTAPEQLMELLARSRYGKR